MNKDSLAKYSAIAEILSSIAIVITLIILSVQTNQNNAMLRAQAQYNALQNRNYIAKLEAEDPIYTAIVIKEFNGEDLSDLEEVRLDRTSRIFINNFEYEYLQFLEGNLRLNDQIYSNFMNSSQRLRLAFNNSKQWRDPRFVAYIENIINE